MHVDANAIIEAAALLAAVVALGTALYSIVKWFQKNEKQSEEIEELNAELAVLSAAMLACLDGLRQLGADGKVTQAHEDLQEHLNQRAHGQKSSK